MGDLDPVRRVPALPRGLLSVAPVAQGLEVVGPVVVLVPDVVDVRCCGPALLAAVPVAFEDRWPDARVPVGG